MFRFCQLFCINLIYSSNTVYRLESWRNEWSFYGDAFVMQIHKES